MWLAEGDGEGVAIRKNQALSCAEGFSLRAARLA